MQELAAPSDMFWGDRMSSLLDDFGHRWDLASHVRDVTPEEMAAAMKQFSKPRLLDLRGETGPAGCVPGESNVYRPARGRLSPAGIAACPRAS